MFAARGAGVCFPVSSRHRPAPLTSCLVTSSVLDRASNFPCPLLAAPLSPPPFPAFLPRLRHRKLRHETLVHKRRHYRRSLRTDAGPPLVAGREKQREVTDIGSFPSGRALSSRFTRRTCPWGHSHNAPRLIEPEIAQHQNGGPEGVARGRGMPGRLGVC